jgi:hypothetical protein
MTEKGMIVVSLAGLLAGGLACIGVALRREWRTARRNRTGCVAEGAVVELVAAGGSPDEPSFLTLVEFRDRRGVRYRVQSKSMQSPAPYKVGQALRVSYEADDPQGADIVDRSIVLWLAAIGLLLTLIATILLTDVLKHGLPAH